MVLVQKYLFQFFPDVLDLFIIVAAEKDFHGAPEAAQRRPPGLDST
jgi:hypothetical protein